ncbi:MAG: M1 family aminopeptidase [Bdellovibrionota bacterium]
MNFSKSNFLKPISVLVVFLFVSPSFGKTLDKLLPFLGNPNIDVLSYHFDIDIPSIEVEEFNVVMDMEVLALKDASEIELHTNAKLIQVNEAYVNGKKVPTSILQGIPGKEAYGLKGDVLSIDNISVNADEVSKVKILYTVKLSSGDTGFYSMKDGNLSYLLTRNWPYYGRFWFPGNDSPLDAAKVSYKITVPKSYMGLANGMLIDEKLVKKNRRDVSVFTWKQEMPTTTYNFVFAVGKFASYTEDICFNEEGIDNERVDCEKADRKIPLEIYYNPNNQVHLEMVESLKKDALSAIYFSKLFGKYEFEKLGFLLSDYPFNMESTSLIVLHDKQASVHEIVHHWWGNNVHIPHWGDFWISEGFTTYVTGLYTEYLTGKNNSCLDYESTKKLNNPESTDPNDIFDLVPYCKGAASIHDLRERLAKLSSHDRDATKAFLNMLSELYKTYKGSALSTEAFIAFVNENAMEIYEAQGIKLDENEFGRVLKAWSKRWYDL